MNTNFDSGISLDWLSFTVEYQPGIINRIIDSLGAVDDGPNDFGGMGYTSSLNILGSGRIYWNIERQEMGIHVRLPAEALALIEMTPLGLMSRIVDWKGHLTRMDVAFDDMDGLLDMDVIYEKLMTGQAVSRFRKMTRIDGRDLLNGAKIGDTINIGARASQSFVRIYDKKLEQWGKNGVEPDTEKWVRVEIELKGEKAHFFAEKLILSGRLSGVPGQASLCCMLLNGLLDFKDEGLGDSNKSRWETSPFWADFLHGCGKLILSMPKDKKTLEDKKRWIRASVSVTLAMIVLSEDGPNSVGGWEFITDCMNEGDGRMKKSQRKMVNEYNKARKQEKIE